MWIWKNVAEHYYAIIFLGMYNFHQLLRGNDGITVIFYTWFCWFVRWSTQNGHSSYCSNNNLILLCNWKQIMWTLPLFSAQRRVAWFLVGILKQQILCNDQRLWEGDWCTSLTTITFQPSLIYSDLITFIWLVICIYKSFCFVFRFFSLFFAVIQFNCKKRTKHFCKYK